MPSTYSPSLKIQLIAVGDETNQWGSITNTNFQYALEEGITGYADATFPSDNNYNWGSLYVNSNSSQPQRNLVIRVLGTISATREFIVPTLEKQYIIFNSTVGSQAILVKTAAGTGVTIPNGARMHVYVDGANVVQMDNYDVSRTIGSLTLTSALPIASGGTGATTQQAAINALAGAVTTGQYLRGNGANVVMSAIQAGDIPTLNQNTTGTAANVTGVVAIANGGTGAATAQLAINALAGATTAGQYLRGNGTNVSMSAIQAGDVPTLNQSTTGSAASVSITGQTGLLTFTGLTSTNRAKTVRDAADTILELGGSYTPSGTWNWTTATATWPTFNQNTTGTAANVTGTVAIANGGTGQTTATAAINALLPSQTSQNGKYLTTDGTNTSWATVSGGVTTFSAGTTGLTPSTATSGAVTLGGTLAVANGGTGVTTSTGTGANVLGTNATLSGVTLNDGFTEEVFAVSGTSPSLSPANGSIQTWSLSANSSPNLGTWNAGQSILLMVDDGTAYTITWPSITWLTNGGTSPVLATTGYTAIVLWKVGSTVYGARVGDNL